MGSVGEKENMEEERRDVISSLFLSSE